MFILLIKSLIKNDFIILYIKIYKVNININEWRNSLTHHLGAPTSVEHSYY